MGKSTRNCPFRELLLQVRTEHHLWGSRETVKTHDYMLIPNRVKEELNVAFTAFFSGPPSIATESKLPQSQHLKLYVLTCLQSTFG